MGSNQLVKHWQMQRKLATNATKSNAELFNDFFFRLNFIRAHFLAIKLALIVD